MKDLVSLAKWRALRACAPPRQRALRAKFFDAPYAPKCLTRLTRQNIWRALRAKIFDAPKWRDIKFNSNMVCSNKTRLHVILDLSIYWGGWGVGGQSASNFFCFLNSLKDPPPPPPLMNDTWMRRVLAVYSFHLMH